MQLKSSDSIISLDVGQKRIGVAVANAVARIPHPLTTVSNDGDTVAALQKLFADQHGAVLVIGLPRGLDGQHTAQTVATETFAAQLSAYITVPTYWQDEAVTSLTAEAELQRKRSSYQKADIDALAATYILEDFLVDHPEIRA